ncbi:MAG: methyltransferase [Magnetococcales bacterium]|nr:methyltransferase [Magnetococcales bacterium]
MTPRPRLLFVHGWGFGPGFFRPLIRLLDDWQTLRLDLGFFGTPRLDIESSGPWIAIGHSTGFLWLLKHLDTPPLETNCIGLVSLMGFSRFVRGHDFPHGIDHRILDKMTGELGRDANRVLDRFMALGGVDRPLAGLRAAGNTERLAEGLDWLASWDERRTLQRWNRPWLALACRDDGIVTPAMTTDCFGNLPRQPEAGGLHWFAQGGHFLPLITQPDPFAAVIRRFVNHCHDATKTPATARVKSPIPPGHGDLHLIDAKRPVRQAFDQAQDYEKNATVQQRVAERLAHGFDLFRQERMDRPETRTPLHGLELGCGTGFLSRLWRQRLPETHLLLTDIAPAMVARARENLLSATATGSIQAEDTPSPRPLFVVMDAERPCLDRSFDLIAASMVFQWLRHPEKSVPALLNLLAPGGRLLFATLGPDTFGEWRTLCATMNIPCGLHAYPDKTFWHDLATRWGFDCTLVEERLEERHASPLAFLKRLKAIGAQTPIPGHEPAPVGKLRPLLRGAEGAAHPFYVTHHLLFGTFSRHQKTAQPIATESPIP